MKTFVYIAESLDGFIAKEDGGIDWLTRYESKEVFEKFEEFIKKIDVLVIGRGTYEKVLTFPEWPYTKKVFVLSSTLQSVPAHLQDKVSLLSMKVKDVIQFLQKEGTENIYVDGGKVIQSFLKEDSIDEMIITRVPELIGSGIPLFGSTGKELSFQLSGSEAFSNGLVTSRYIRKR